MEGEDAKVESDEEMELRDGREFKLGREDMEESELEVKLDDGESMPKVGLRYVEKVVDAMLPANAGDLASIIEGEREE